VTVNGVGRFATEVLFSAARQVISEGGSREIASLEDITANLSVEGDAVVIFSSDNRMRVSLRELMALSPRREQRLTSLREMKEWLGPTSKEVSSLAMSAEGRTISDDEMLQALEELRRGVAWWHARFGAAIAAGKFGMEEFAPEDLAYYDKLAGPDPEGREPEEYIRGVLLPYRQSIVEADPKRGLEMCLLGCLRDDLTLAGTLGGVTDADLWDIIHPLSSAEDPFTLLGVLEVAIARSSDSRFMGLTEVLVDRLMSLELRRADGTDVYEIMPSIAAAVLRRLNTFEHGPERPPYWKRFAAWVQAGVMIRMLAESKIEVGPFVQWMDQSGVSAGRTRNLVDLRLEPMWSAFEITTGRLRGEVLGRLFGILSRWEHSATSIPESIRRTFERELASKPEALMEACMPGPLEGHRRSGVARLLESRLVEEVQVWAGRLEGPQSRQAWAFLGQVAQAISYGDTILATIRARVREARLAEKPAAEEIGLEDLGWAGMIAAAHRDGQLGDAVGERCVMEAERARSPEDAALLFHSLLIAAASHRGEGEWRSWLESKLLDLSARLPFGRPSRRLGRYLEDLKIIMPMEDNVWSKAEAMAALAS
jgi:hypothetical protein